MNKRPLIKYLFYTSIVLYVVSFASCRQDKAPVIVEMEAHPNPVLPTTPYNYNDTLPTHFDAPVLQFFNSTPSNNPITDEGATLGRVLFYDKQLSADNTVACASCHLQERAFSDPVAFSVGINGQHSSRNSMSCVNMRWGFRFFWDLRANGLENQVLMPIQDPKEMAMDLNDLEEKLSGISYYPELFYEAFGDSNITQTNIARALAQFLRSIVSYRSKYDEGVASNFSNFTSDELAGKQLFYNGQTRCNQCHMTELFISNGGMNNGLDLQYLDNGVGDFSGNPSQNGQFKTVTLRNIELTGPYMHDGRFTSLEEVMNHYDGNIQQHVNLSDQLTNDFEIGGTPIELNLTPQEKQQMIAFMKTLTDYSLINDPRFSNPFPQ